MRAADVEQTVLALDKNNTLPTWEKWFIETNQHIASKPHVHVYNMWYRSMLFN